LLGVEHVLGARGVEALADLLEGRVVVRWSSSGGKGKVSKQSDVEYRKSVRIDEPRSHAEFFLQEALELALYHRFCKSREALILHGKLHDSAADFALLDKSRKPILVAVKEDQLTPGKNVADVTEQLTKYVKVVYPKRTLREHATLYCRHGVEVSASFEYRNPDYVQTCTLRNKQRPYGWLNLYCPRHFEYYRQGEDPAQALEILRGDYEYVVGGSLDGLSPNEPLPVNRGVVNAELGRSELPARIDEVPVELWNFVSPTNWLRSQRGAEP
jgi:hypothetical protein